MKALYDLPAPAKLNLFLHVTGRRDDGYHLLQSAFMLLDWCDVLHFDLTRTGHIEREDLTQPLPADDLIVRIVEGLPLTAPVVVVTDDGELRDRVGALGAMAVRLEPFLAVARRSGHG